MTKTPWHICEGIAATQEPVPTGFSNLDVYRAYCAALVDALLAAAMQADPDWVQGEKTGTFARTGKQDLRSPKPLREWYERIGADRTEALGEIVRLTVHQKHGLVAPPLS